MAKKIIVIIWLFLLSGLDIYRINTRRTYYPNPLIAKIFENKLGFTVHRFTGQLLKTLDVNRYLFSSHPREGDPYEF